MERIAFVMKVKPGYEEEYMRRHTQVSPALLELFKTVGICHYSIFMDGNQLFACLESEDYQAARERMKKEPAYNEWQEFMKPLMLEVGENHSTSKFIKEVFYFE